MMSGRAVSEARDDARHHRNAINDNGGNSLPEGSSFFQEVMAELNPHPSPKPSRKTSRRLSKHKRPHFTKYGTSDLQSKADCALVEEDAETEEEDDTEEEIEDGEKERGKKKEGKGSPERMILHGKCHCYYVENGNVKGLADLECHHPHRSSPSPTRHPPFSSSSSSPHHHLSPATSPRLARKLSPTSSLEGSLKANNKVPSHHTLQLPTPAYLEDFRGRSHSDTAVMARLSNFRKASRSSASITNASSHFTCTSPRLQASPTSSSPCLSERPPGTPPSSSPRKTRDSDLADEVLESLHVSSPSSPRPGRTVSSDQLHYLYDQFLRSGSESPSRDREA